jgi:uncharacterized OB-fold protein
MDRPKRVPIKEGLLTLPLSPTEQVRLAGTRCKPCGESFFGKKSFCKNCFGESMEEIRLSNRGRLYSYTVIRHRPPGDDKGPDPFTPFGLGLVELPEAVKRSKKTQLVTCFDLFPEKRKVFSEKYGCDQEKSYEDVIR